MKMVREDGESQHVDSKLPGQELEPIFEPGFAMVEILAGQRVIAAEKAATDAAIDAVKDGDFRRIEHIRPCQSRHVAFSPNGHHTTKSPTAGSKCTCV